jgi:hypothetical protein
MPVSLKGKLASLRKHRVDLGSDIITLALATRHRLVRSDLRNIGHNRISQAAMIAGREGRNLLAGFGRPHYLPYDVVAGIPLIPRRPTSIK